MTSGKNSPPIVYSGPLDGSGTLINGGTTPVVYTDDGKILPAGKRQWVAALDDTGRRAVMFGYLRWKPDPVTTTSDTTLSGDTNEAAASTADTDTGPEPIADESGPSSTKLPRSTR